MDFRAASVDKLDQHAMELLSFGTGELSPILKGHLFIESFSNAHRPEYSQASIAA
jgi:hypothetical protein